MAMIFDLDGTLVDSMGEWIGSMREMLDRFGITEPEDFVKTITPLGDRKAAQYLIGLGVKLPAAQLIEEMHGDSVRKYTESIPAKETVIDTIRALHARGEVMAVLTASPHVMLDPCLKRLGIHALFTEVWSCDDFGMTKSDPEIFRQTAARLGLDTSDCVFIDDNLIALQTAKAAGMQVYGMYDPFSDPYREEIIAMSDRYVERMEEILS